MQSTPPPTSPSFKVRTAFCGLLIGLLTLAAGAVSAQSIPNAGPNSGVRWRTIEAGVAAPRSGTLTMIMHSQGEFEAFWRILNGNTRPPTLGVAWGKEFVIGICPGTSAAGASASLQTIVRTGPSKATAYWGVRTSPFGLSSARPGGSPWELDAVEYFGGTLTFSQVPMTRQTGNFTVIGGMENPSCFSGPPIVINTWTNNTGFDFVDIPWRIVDGGWYSYGSNPQCGIISNQIQLEAWMRVTYGPQAVVPRNIQWQGQMFAAISIGQQPSPCGIEIGRIQPDGRGGYQVVYAVGPPAPDAVKPTLDGLSPNLLVSPYLIVRLPQLNGPVSFLRVDPKSLSQMSSGQGRTGQTGQR